MGRSAETYRCHLPVPSPNRPVEPARTRLDISRADGHRPARRQGELHRARGRLPPVIQPIDLHRRAGVSGVDDAELTDLRAIAARVEERYVITPRPALDYAVVHAGQKAVRGPDVGVRLDVEGGGQLQAPVPLAVTHATGQPLGGVALLEVARVEVHGVLRGNGEGDRAVPNTGIVDGLDGDRTRFVRVVDDTNEPLHRTVGRRRHQREVIPRRYGLRALAARRNDAPARVHVPPNGRRPRRGDAPDRLARGPAAPLPRRQGMAVSFLGAPQPGGPRGDRSSVGMDPPLRPLQVVRWCRARLARADPGPGVMPAVNAGGREQLVVPSLVGALRVLRLQGGRDLVAEHVNEPVHRRVRARSAAVDRTLPRDRRASVERCNPAPPRNTWTERCQAVCSLSSWSYPLFRCPGPRFRHLHGGG